jgi:FAD/FMN-containing dehydrogenase
MTSAANFEALRARLAGEVILPQDSRYDETRRIFNAMHDKRPAVIARCARTEDVVAAVNFGRDNQLPIAVRSSGHSVAGFGVCDDGILIDLSGLKKMQVDASSRTARSGGGVLWGEFDAATQQHGLHTPGGRVTTTGVGGFTTGGGYGWTSSKYGLTCDDLVSAEVVLADGRIVTASAREHEDLFWGIRGGGGNFGVVTEFEFQLHPLGPIVMAGLALWPIERAAEVTRKWRDYVDAGPDELSTAIAVVTTPPEPFVPEGLRGQIAFGLIAMYVGDATRGAEVIHPLKNLGPVVDLIQPMPYTVFQSLTDPMAPKGFRSYWRGEYLKGLSDGAIDTFVKHAPALTAAGGPLSQMIIFKIGQGVAAVRDDATAFSHRDANYLFHPISVWQQPTDDQQLIAKNRAFCDAMRPFSTGAVYLNFTPEDRVRDAYGVAKYAKLVTLKDRYDPDNLFRLNQNIKPSRTPGELTHA